MIRPSIHTHAGRAIGWPDKPESEGGLPSSKADEILEWERTFASRPGNWHRTSMLADIEAGECGGGPRPIEVEVIFGEPVRLARKYGVVVPVSVFLLPCVFLVVSE
jgi:ketopantoate reductase